MLTASRTLGPLSVPVKTGRDAVRDIVGAVLRKQPLQVAFANTHLLYCAVRDPGYASDMERFYLVNDGIGLNLLARMACGRGFEENLNGTDLTPRVLAALPFGTRVLLVGARPRVVRRAAHRMLQRWPHLEICAYHDGYAGGARALQDLRDLKPDVVLVGMGNPRQERWISQGLEAHPSAVFLGVGALFDFIAEAVPRAPEGLRRLRLEWAFRLAQEPRRLWRRYTVEIFVVTMALLAAPRHT